MNHDTLILCAGIACHVVLLLTVARLMFRSRTRPDSEAQLQETPPWWVNAVLWVIRKLIKRTKL